MSVMAFQSLSEFQTQGTSSITISCGSAAGVELFTATVIRYFGKISIH